jgi:hypothetical protein
VFNNQETIKLPVCSALFKQRTSRLVVRWVTTSKYLLLYVFATSSRTSASFFCASRRYTKGLVFGDALIP